MGIWPLKYVKSSPCLAVHWILTRSQLKYHIQFRTPPSRRTWISCSVWRKGMRIFRGLINIPPKEESEEVQLVSLEKRRWWGCVILGTCIALPAARRIQPTRFPSPLRLEQTAGLNWSMGGLEKLSNGQMRRMGTNCLGNLGSFQCDRPLTMYLKNDLVKLIML